MAHKLLEVERPIKKEKRFKLPQLNGKFGISIMFGTKEIFIGVAVGQIEVEQIVRRRMVKATRAKVKVMTWD